MLKKLTSYALIIFFLFPCDRQGKKNIQLEQFLSKDTTAQISSKKDELYLGKIFYSGDELNDYTFIKSEELSNDDNLSYSIYKSNDKNEFVISIEKLISNTDQGKYKIIDAFKFKNYSPINTKVVFSKNHDKLIIIINDKDKTLKEWNFKQNTSIKKNVNIIEEGKYLGNFLRLKEESGDPRAWGQINLEINGKNSLLKVDSYVENVQKKLEVVKKTENQIELKAIDSDKTLILIKESNKFIMKGDLMESIVGAKKEYEMKKIED